MIRIINIFKKQNVNSNNDKKMKTLYSNVKQTSMIKGVELPVNWTNFKVDELRNQARNAILELSKISNSDFKAKELGFKDTKHLMDLCFDFILK